MDDKDSLRREAILHRARIERDAEHSQKACDLFLEAFAPAPGQVVAGYWPHGTEFSPLEILHALLRQGTVCALPVLRADSADRILDFHRWDESVALVKGRFGLFQPASGEGSPPVDPDIVLVPLLAFDRKGYRLGYGKGYYDATLAALRARKSVVAVGLAWAEQAVLFNLPRAAHDVPLDWVVTPQGVRRFGQALEEESPARP